MIEYISLTFYIDQIDCHLDIKPVRMAARAGVHDGVDVQEFVNIIPSAARLSRFGVIAPELGYALIESCLC